MTMSLELKLVESLKDGVNFNYVLFDNGVAVGSSQIRTKSSKSKAMPIGFESHMSYEIFSEFQRKGYGKRLFYFSLEKLFERGVIEPIITCDDDNIPSKKIIESSGGILLEKKYHQNGKLINKYIFRKE
jgi:predicted acetyltransferase